MSQLAVGVNSSETLWTVDAVPDPEFGFYTVGSEIVQVIAGFPASDPGYAVGQTFPSKIRVVRATNDTTAASHLAGVALAAVTASGGGAGGIDVTDGTTTVSGATSLSLPPFSVTDQGGGVASAAVVSFLGPFTVNYNDPGLAEAVAWGIPTLTIPAGVLVTPIAIVGSNSWAAGTLYVALGTGSAEAIQIASFNLSDAQSQTYALAEFGHGDAVNGVTIPSFSATLPRWAMTVEECQLFVSAFAETPPFPGGSADIYAIVVAPV